MLFKQYDFRPNPTGRHFARNTFHHSFADPYHDAWKDCPGRRSLECRLCLTFDEEAPLPGEASAPSLSKL